MIECFPKYSRGRTSPPTVMEHAAVNAELQQASAPAKATIETLQQQLAHLRELDGHRTTRSKPGQLSMVLATLVMPELDEMHFVKVRWCRHGGEEAGDAILEGSGREVASRNEAAAIRALIAAAAAAARTMRAASEETLTSIEVSNGGQHSQVSAEDNSTEGKTATLPGDE